MFLDVLRRRNPETRSPPQSTCTSKGSLPAEHVCVRHTTRLRPTPGIFAAEAARLEPHAVRDDQAVRAQSRRLPGHHRREHHSERRRRHGMRARHQPSRDAAGPRWASGPGRPRRGGCRGGHAPGQLDGLFPRQGPRGRTGLPGTGPRAGAASPHLCAPETSSTPDTRAVSTSTTSWPSPMPWTLSTARTSPASPPSRRCCSTRRRAPCGRPTTCDTLERVAQTAARRRPLGPADQRTGHDLDPCARGSSGHRRRAIPRLGGGHYAAPQRPRPVGDGLATESAIRKVWSRRGLV